MTNSSPVLCERRNGVLILTNNAAPMYRMSFAYMDALEAAIDAAANDPAVRC